MNQPNIQRQRKNTLSAFTMIELLLVVAIVGILSSLALFASKGFAERAKSAEASNNIGAMVRGIRINWEDNGAGQTRCLPVEFVTSNTADGNKARIPNQAENDLVSGTGISINDAIYYQYEWRALTPAVAGSCSNTGLVADSTIGELYAIHDFDGDGNYTDAYRQAVVVYADGTIGPRSDGLVLINDYAAGL